MWILFKTLTYKVHMFANNLNMKHFLKERLKCETDFTVHSNAKRLISVTKLWLLWIGVEKAILKNIIFVNVQNEQISH